MPDWRSHPVSRRAAIGTAVALGAVGLRGGDRSASAAGHVDDPSAPTAGSHHTPGNNTVVGTVDHVRNGFDPADIVTDFDYGELTVEEDGRAVRQWVITAVDRELEVAPGVFFPAWTFNGRVPGPTLRCVEGERLRILFQNGGSHPHSMHFHGIHSARMDGVPGGPGMINPGEDFVYEFEAKPFGCHLYHCHAMPLKRHIHKGMYGAFIVDPDPARHPEEHSAALARRHATPEHAVWQEFVMVMNGFDTNFDDENEFYAVNSIPFAYFNNPIRIERSRPVRIYLINVTEFDPINSFHLHANFFDYYDHGTTLTPTLRTIDTVMQCQAQRGIIEFSFADHEPGLYMFHAHQSEFAELGWMSHLEVV
ncbi:multicopper oxidase domain-containing protein [Bauldia litoralis]|uniref:Copper-containing nitrite reductase n=1 Tax=Bauldia litoralis TaxID=665467 RepID=A0A1G6BPS4_9HYPH|nr:multicopper oxidase domain-containing protein [Bauldia litoralis]SDB22568.1 Multicopper oxidase [Bauldia litoralis]